MGYVGNQTSNSYSSMDKQTITGNGGASYTLTHAVANAQEIEVFVNNVRQEAGVAYTVNGTALSMTGNVASTDDFYVIYQGKALQTVVPPDGSVSTGKLASGAVTDAKIDTMAATKLTGTIDNARMPAGSIIQVVQNTFAPASNEATTSTSYQASGWNITVQKKQSDSKLLVTVAGGHSYNDNFANGCISTICQESGTSTFTASTTYATGNDPASSYTFGMQQVYNASALNTAPHSKNWLFDSSGNEFEAFRLFFKSRTSGRNAIFFESGHIATITVMEIAQ